MPRTDFALPVTIVSSISASASRTSVAAARLRARSPASQAVTPAFISTQTAAKRLSTRRSCSIAPSSTARDSSSWPSIAVE